MHFVHSGCATDLIKQPFKNSAYTKYWYIVWDAVFSVHVYAHYCSTFYLQYPMEGFALGTQESNHLKNCSFTWSVNKKEQNLQYKQMLDHHENS